MNFSRQALLGIGMIVGGSVMLYAMVQQIGDSNAPTPVVAIVDKSDSAQEMPQLLTTDIETEKRILAQKQKERAARVAEQEKRAQQFMVEQETAETQALAKSRAENERYVANSATVAEDIESLEAVQKATDTSKAQAKKAADTNVTNAVNNVKNEATQDTEKLVQAADDAVKDAKEKKQAQAQRQAEIDKQAQAAAEQKRQDAEQVVVTTKQEPPKPSSDYKVKSGDGLLKLARQYDMPVEALAQANNLSPSASLQLGQTLNIPSRKQVQRLEREAQVAVQAREEKREKEATLVKQSADAKQKLRDARKEVKETDAKGSFGVQVALADNQAKADEMVKKFKSAGYQVKTSPTSRGVRVVVGPERGKVAALALKDKINSDPKINTDGAWVLYWR